MKRLTLILMMLSFAVPTWALAELEIHMEQKEENGQSLTVFSAEETQTEENTPAPDATPNPALLMANGLIESCFEQTKAAQLTQRAGAELAQSGEVYTVGNVVSLILRWNGTQTDGTAGSAVRALVLDRTTGEIGHRHFYEIAELLRPGDCLVLNNSRVLPARLLGHREPTGGAVEVLLLRDKGDGVWECLTKPGRKTHTGTELSFGDGELTATVVGEVDDGNKLVQFHYEGIFLEVLERLGKMPLPPYIKEELEDGERYQTVYSKINGSAAAPTAGLHFTKELLEKIAAKGVKIAYVTLHVGLGTFRPVKAEEITEHHMHSEFCMMDAETAEILNETRRNGGRIVCCGTTSCRTVESLVQEDGSFSESSKWTEIFIYPGYKFRAMDALITNFHLPESTLVMLVSAFAGREHILHAYETAVQERYRFFSFGDAMFIGDVMLSKAENGEKPEK